MKGMHLTKKNTCYIEQFKLFCFPPTLISDNLQFPSNNQQNFKLNTDLIRQCTTNKNFRGPTTNITHNHDQYRQYDKTRSDTMGDLPSFIPKANQ